MNGIWAITIISSILFLGALGLSQDAFATDGTVHSFQKIAEGVGGFTGDLDASDFFSPVASIGDLNDDGVNDLVVGAPGDRDSGANSGAVYILFMNADGTVSSSVKITENLNQGGFTGDLDATDYFGYSVAGLGDLDGDGVEDIAVGAPLDDDEDSNSGAVWILFLDADGTVDDARTAGVKISDTGTGGFTGVLNISDHFGSSIANIGDLDNDGIIDIAVGAPKDEDGGAGEKGAVWILFLDADGTVADDDLDGTKISDTAGDFTATLGVTNFFGGSVAGIGDLDGDNIEDIAVGSPADDDVASNTGAVFILFLGVDGAVDGFQKISDSAGEFTGDIGTNDHFGGTVTRAGDLNGDGVEDIAVGAEGDDEAGSAAGAVWILFMKNTGKVDSFQKITEGVGGFTGDLDAADYFGGGLAFSLFGGGTISITDIDGDNTEDLIIGAPQDGGNAGGAIYILFMGLGVSTATSTGGGDSSAPSLGTGSNGNRLIDDGFAYNNNPIDVNDYRTDFPLVRTPVGQINTLDLKIFENQGVNNIWFVTVQFGVPQVGAQGEAMVTYYPGIGYTKIHDPNNLLGEIDITLDPVKCKENSKKEKCVGFSLEHSFNEAPIHDVVRVTIADKTRNHSDVFFNDGVEVFGDSLNPPDTASIAVQDKGKGLVHLVQTDRAQELWVDQEDNTWTKNSMGNFFQVTPDTYSRVIDDSTSSQGYNRGQEIFRAYMDGQELYAIQVWDGTLIQSELPKAIQTEAYGYILGDDNPAPRINDVALQADMLRQIERAQQKWDSQSIQGVIDDYITTLYTSKESNIDDAMISESDKAKQLLYEMYGIK